MEYLALVEIHQVAELTLGEESTALPSPSVSVHLFGTVHETKSMTDVAMCTFEHAISVTKHVSDEEFGNSDIKVEVLHYQGFGRTVVLGHCIFSMGQIYMQEQHHVPKCWHSVTKVGSPGSLVGFVELTLGVFKQGDAVPRMFCGVDTTLAEGATSIKNRVVKAPKRNKVKDLVVLCVRAYRAEALRNLSYTFYETYDPYVELSFYGTILETVVDPGKRTPVWNSELRLPFQNPCWDNSATVTVKNRGAVIGELTLDITDIMATVLPPTWFNFYCVPPEAQSGALQNIWGGNGTAEASYYAGRVLISAAIERTDTPTMSVVPANIEPEPAIEKHAMWVDFYEVYFDGKVEPAGAYGTVFVGCGLNEVRTMDAERHSELVWPQGSGRIPEQVLNLNDKTMCGDIMVSIYANFPAWHGDKWMKHMFCRIPMSSAYSWDVKPQWYEMMLVGSGSGPKNAGFLLMTVNVGPVSERPERPKPEELNLKRYHFRANIFQAFGLPFKAREGGSDPFVVVFFGPLMLSTDVVTWSMHPTWNQCLQAMVELPDKRALRPDIILYVLDHLDGGVEPLAMLRVTGRDLRSTPDEPTWLDLEQAPGGVPTTARILVSFGLVAAEKAEECNPHLTPATRDCKLEFYALGVRIWDEALAKDPPQLAISWGRREDDRDKPKKQKGTPQGEGAEGDYNFRQNISMSCKLSENPKYHEWLEVRLLSDGDEPGTLKVRAFAMIPLVDYMQWIDHNSRKSFQKKLSAMVQKKKTGPEGEGTKEGGKEGDKKGDKKDSKDGDQDSEASGEERDEDTRNESLQRAQETLVERFCWDVPSMDASNIRTKAAMQHTTLDQEDTDKCQEEFHNMISCSSDKRGMLTPGSRSGSFSDLDEAEEEEDDDEEAEQNEETKLTNLEIEFEANFTWPTNTEFEEIDQHPEFECGLEQGPLQFDDLPYERTPLYVGTEWGELRQVGVLKFCCRVVEKQFKHAMGGDREWDNRLKSIDKLLEKTQDLTIRAYVLAADGLVPKCGIGDISTFAVARLQCANSTGTFIQEDRRSVRHSTLHPVFNTYFNFTGCRFPGNCILSLGIKEFKKAGMFSAGGESLIGETHIDVEDRYFLERYIEMMEANVVPIESRTLRDHDSFFGKGHVRVLIDIMPQAYTTRKILQLPSVDPLPFELRVVIWKVTGIDQIVDGDQLDIYCTAKHTLDTGEELVQQTDTHYDAGSDGKGTFNWRCIFTLMCPCRDPKLQLRVWDDNILSDEPLAEVILDLAHDFHIARQHCNVIEIERGTVRLTHPAFPGQVRCEMDIEAKLLPQAEALMQPQGNKRDPPNDDPFLNADDPHLKEHRDYLNNMAAVKNIKAVGNALVTGAKWMTYLYIAGSVIGGLVFAIFSIVMLAK